MLQIVRTTTQHIETIKQFLQLEQMEEIIDVDIEGMFSIVDEYENVYMVFKTIVFWKGRGIFKSFIARNCRTKLFGIVKILKNLYKEYAPERLEVEILYGFKQAIRLAEMFGFHKESLMFNYYHHKDYYLYVKFKTE